VPFPTSAVSNSSRLVFAKEAAEVFPLVFSFGPFVKLLSCGLSKMDKVVSSIKICSVFDFVAHGVTLVDLVFDICAAPKRFDVFDVCVADFDAEEKFCPVDLHVKPGMRCGVFPHAPK